MGKTNPPTSEQRKFFENTGVVCPPSKIVARTLINYIQSNRNKGTKEERILMLQEAQRKWINAPVTRLANKTLCGTILYLSARSPQMLLEAYGRRRTLKERGMVDFEVSPFLAVVDIGKNQTITTALDQWVPAE